MFDEKQLNLIKRIVDEALRSTSRQKIAQSDIPPGTIKYRHLEDVAIVFGLEVDRPASGTDSGVRAYFETDTGVLGLWDGTQWLETTLS